MSSSSPLKWLSGSRPHFQTNPSWCRSSGISYLRFEVVWCILSSEFWVLVIHESMPFCQQKQPQNLFLQRFAGLHEVLLQAGSTRCLHLWQRRWIIPLGRADCHTPWAMQWWKICLSLPGTRIFVIDYYRLPSIPSYLHPMSIHLSLLRLTPRCLPATARE